MLNERQFYVPRQQSQFKMCPQFSVFPRERPFGDLKGQQRDRTTSQVRSGSNEVVAAVCCMQYQIQNSMPSNRHTIADRFRCCDCEWTPSNEQRVILKRHYREACHLSKFTRDFKHTSATSVTIREASGESESTSSRSLNPFTAKHCLQTSGQLFQSFDFSWTRRGALSFGVHTRLGSEQITFHNFESFA
jgi:hypothetical protein